MTVTIDKTNEGFEVSARGSERVYIYPTRTRALRKAGELLEAPEPTAPAPQPEITTGSVSCPIDMYPSAPPPPADNTCREAAPSIGSPEWKESFSHRLQELKTKKSQTQQTEEDRNE